MFAGEGRGYETMLLTRHYQHRPTVPCHLTKLHMSSLDLLRHGTSCVGTDVSPCRDTLRQKSCSPIDTVRQVAQVRDWCIRCGIHYVCRVSSVQHICKVFIVSVIGHLYDTCLQGISCVCRVSSVRHMSGRYSLCLLCVICTTHVCKVLTVSVVCHLYDTCLQGTHCVSCVSSV